MPTVYFVPANKRGDGVYYKNKRDAIRKASDLKRPVIARKFTADFLVRLLNNESEFQVEEEQIFTPAGT